MPLADARRLVLAALLAVPVQAARDSGGAAAPAGKIKGVRLQILDCDPERAAEIEKYVQDAVPYVDCLAGVNPKIARSIGANFKNFVFHCGSWPSAQGAKAAHVLDASGKLKRADITYNFGASGAQYPPEARIYHEMIHAIDLPDAKHPDGRLITTAKQHANAGFPDAVYGCHFACHQGGMGDDEGKMIANVVAALKSEGTDLGKDSHFRCGGGECGVVEVYAGICRKGEPLQPRAVKDEARRKDRPNCLFETMLNACDLGKTEKKRKANCEKPVVRKSPLCRLRCEYDAAGEDEAKLSAVSTKVMSSANMMSRFLDKDGEGLEGDDAVYYHELKLRKLLDRCR